MLSPFWDTGFYQKFNSDIHGSELQVTAPSGMFRSVCYPHIIIYIYVYYKYGINHLYIYILYPNELVRCICHKPLAPLNWFSVSAVFFLLHTYIYIYELGYGAPPLVERTPWHSCCQLIPRWTKQPQPCLNILWTREPADSANSVSHNYRINNIL